MGPAITILAIAKDANTAFPSYITSVKPTLTVPNILILDSHKKPYNTIYLSNCLNHKCVCIKNIKEQPPPYITLSTHPIRT